MTGRLFRVWLDSFERKMTCQIECAFTSGSVYWTQQQGLCPETCVPLVPTAKHRQLDVATGPGYHIAQNQCPKEWSTFSVVRNRQGCWYRRHKKMQYHGCHGMEIHYACHNTELLCEMGLWHCRFFQWQQSWWKQTNGTMRPNWLSQFFWQVS